MPANWASVMWWISAPKKISVARCASARRSSPWTSRVNSAASAPLGDPPARIGKVLRLDAANLLLFQVREESQTAAHVGVVEIDPVLIEAIRTGPLRRKPEGAGLRLPHLRPVAPGQERAGDAVELNAEHPPRQVDAGGDVSPLIAAAGLKPAAKLPLEMDEIVGLEEHVAELGVAHSRVAPLQAAADGVLGEHDVDGKMLADVAEEFEISEAAHPVVVVHQQRGIAAAVEVEEPPQLGLHGGDVGAEHFQGEEVSLLALAAGVADHAGGPADKRDGPMPGC